MPSTKKILLWPIFIAFLLLNGCYTSPGYPSKGLAMGTRMSANIFLEPVPQDKKTIFLQIRNTSNQSTVDLETPIKVALQNKGYQVALTLADAHYVLQINLLQFGRSDAHFCHQTLNQGFGNTISEIAFNIALEEDAYKKPVTYSTATDVQISERIGKSMVVKEKSNSKMKKDTPALRELTAMEKVDWKRYQTRIIHEIHGTHLTFKKAIPLLTEGLTATVTGIF